jgi:hypothetical protein
MEFFEKYRYQDVGPTRTRLAELIASFEEARKEMTVEELEALREELDELTDRLKDERVT